jgi:ABC-2 type transport system ATP-binding protein
MTQALIETRGLTKRYGGVTALKPLDWQVEVGSITGVLGPNGAGKTTLAKLVMGITGPSKGTVSVLGQDVARDPEAVRTTVGFLPEDKLLYDEMSVAAFLRFYGSFFSTWDTEAAGDLLKAWDIPTTPRIKELSKGNRAKLVLGAVLCRKPRILLLDEPTIDLDPASAEEILSLVAQWTASEERCVVITTHRLEEVERICDRVLFLQEGEAVLQDDLDDIRARWKLVRASGSIPSAEVLESWDQVRKVEAGAGWTAITVEGGAEDVAERLREGGAATVDVEGVSLREIYLTLTHYQRGRLDGALEGVV